MLMNYLQSRLKLNKFSLKTKLIEKYLLLSMGFLIGEHGELPDGDAFLARKLLIGDPPIKAAFPAKGRYRLDKALLLLLRFPCRCFVACNAVDEVRLDPI